VKRAREGLGVEDERASSHGCSSWLPLRTPLVSVCPGLGIYMADSPEYRVVAGVWSANIVKLTLSEDPTDELRDSGGFLEI
jgi:hypothetical protein